MVYLNAFLCYICSVVQSSSVLNFRDMMATGGEDKLVRIYYLATITDQPLKIFSGSKHYFPEILSRDYHSDILNILDIQYLDPS